MALDETKYIGRKFRQCIDNTPGNKKWNVFSLWTHSRDVEFDDGMTAQEKIGNFKGVTTNENQVAGYAADVTLLKSIKTALTNLITSLASLVSSINERLGGLRFYEDSTGKYVVGADSVPKKLGSGHEKIIDVFFNKRSKSISVRGELVTDPSTGNTHEVGAIYGHIAEFDLSEHIPEYNTMSLGQDFIVTIANIQSTQENINYPLQIIKEEQFDDTALNYNSVSIADFPAITDVPVWGGNGSSQTTYRANFARYNPNTGKLYIITGSTATANAIGMYRI